MQFIHYIQTTLDMQYGLFYPYMILYVLLRRVVNSTLSIGITHYDKRYADVARGILFSFLFALLEEESVWFVLSARLFLI